MLRDAVDGRFEFVRYAERLAASQPSFEPLAAALAAPPNLVDERLAALTLAAVDRHRPTLVLLSVPFPGSMYAALRIAQAIKAQHPNVTIALGGGFVNTELRELAEPRLFDFVDFVTLDAGERPLLALLEHLQGRRSQQRLVRTFVRDNVSGSVRYINFAEPDVPFEDAGTPTWDGLPLDRYLSLLDMLNPMHRLWSDGRWNKLTVAHGCYWKKCSFCDVSLDYIARYEQAGRRDPGRPHRGHRAGNRADRLPLRRRGRAARRRCGRWRRAATAQVAITWWGNIRFEKTFTPRAVRGSSPPAAASRSRAGSRWRPTACSS